MSTNVEPHIPSPLWDRPTRRLAAIALVIAVLALGFFLLFGLLDSIIVAALVAFLVEPVIRWGVNRLRMKRWLSLLIVYLIVAAIAFGAVLLLPALLIGSIAQIDVAEIVASIDEWVSDLAASIASSEFMGMDMSGMAAVEGAVSDAAGSTSGFDPDRLLAAFEGFISAFAGVLGVVIGAISAIFFVIIVAVYLSADWERYVRGVAGLASPPFRPDLLELGRRLNRAWSDYVRGQGIMVVVIGFTTFIVTWLLGVPGALFLGVIAGLLEVIPTFGPIIATIPAVLIALFQGSTRFVDMNNLVFALIVIVAYILIQQLESNLIAPKVMGESVKLPALVVLISIAAGYQVAGILGAILAVPVVASSKVLLSYVWAKIHTRDPWATLPDDVEDPLPT
jgi:predicted PurR-regulated permease PerM